MKTTLSIFLVFIIFGLKAQIVSIDPPLFTIDEEISVIYDATQGSAGLVDVTPVYAHTGVITESGGPGSWQYVQGNWGTADPKVVMAPIGDNKHIIQFTPREFYSIPTNEVVTQLSFVFRNQDGSKEGKTASLGDIFIDVPNLDEFTGKFITPDQEQLVVEQGDNFSILAAITSSSDYVLYDNDVVISMGTGTEISFDYTAIDVGNHIIRFEATDGTDQVEDSFSFVVLDGDSAKEEIPEDVKYGATILDNNSVLLRLFAPEKNHVFVLSDLNDFKVDANFQMTQTPDEQDWWIILENDVNDTELLYQFLVDGFIKIADPYSELILDPFSDGGIDPSLESIPVSYPSGLTSGHLTYLNLEEDLFQWENDDFQLPETEDLVIYELLLRDFLADNSFESLIDTLTYLKRLGVNAIELMPVSEFENNDSWGYNPSYHMALDKYYGSPESFKKLVDAAHGMGIAILLDIVYNHAFGQCPLVRLYWDSQNSRPAENSPYFNPVAKHPFNVGFDFNHGSEATITYTKQTIDYWLSEYHVDGFRFDLSKGFTQQFFSENGGFSAYNQERIDILSDYGNHIWDQYPESILILEHFATSSEERELADRGFLLWGNANYTSNEATMGYNDAGKSNFSFVYYKNQGWTEPHIVSYMESHDEERLMYKNTQFGNVNGGYDVRELNTGLDRNEMTAAFFFSIPGPKMIWQFGELGYDFSINTCEDGTVNENCRLARKPIRWDYYNESERENLYDVYSKMFDLKVNYPAVDKDAEVALNLGGVTKSIVSSKGDDYMFVIGNFDVVEQSVTVDLPISGRWYDYLEGGSITSAISYSVNLAPGEYHVYVSDPAYGTNIEEEEKGEVVELDIFPNPTNNSFSFQASFQGLYDLVLYNTDGKKVLEETNLIPGQFIDLTNVGPGIYFIRFLCEGETVDTKKIVVVD